MTRTITLFGALGLLATGCGDKDTGDSDSECDDTAGCEDECTDSGGCDTDVECVNYADAPYIGLSADYCDTPTDDDGNPPADALLVGCDETDGVWFYDVYTVGLTSGADLDITQTGSENGWDESHPVETFDNGEDWDNLYLELTDVATTDEVIDGSTTLYDCGDEDRAASLTWAITLYDADGVDAGCWAFGHDVSSTGCTEYTWE